VIALLSPTKSRSKVAQMIGRGTRLAPGKSHATIIDFCPGRMRKGRLASPADALAGKMLPDLVYAELASDGDLVEAISNAETTAAAKADALAERQARAEARAAEKAERIARLAAESRRRAYSYQVQEHDAAGILGGAGKADGKPVMRSHDGPREAEEQARARLGLCSPKQAAQLRRFGLRDDISRQLAGEVMASLVKNNWEHVDAKFLADKRFAKVRK